MPHDVHAIWLTTVVRSPPSEIARGATRPSPVLRVNSPDAFPRVGTLVGLTTEVVEDTNVVVEDAARWVVAETVTVVELELEGVVDFDELPQADPVSITHTQRSPRRQAVDESLPQSVAPRCPHPNRRNCSDRASRT